MQAYLEIIDYIDVYILKLIGQLYQLRCSEGGILSWHVLILHQLYCKQYARRVA